MRWALPFALVAVWVTTAEHAFAQEPDHTQADALFAEGRDLLEKGKFIEACAKLARSEELAPAVGTLLNLAYCNEQIGKLRSAMDAYAKAEQIATAAGETKRAAFAKDRFAAVEPRAPKLVVRIVPPEVAGLEVKRNGTVLAKSDFDHPIAVDPQDYVVTASAPGHMTWKGAIVVKGEGAVVTMLIPSLDDAAALPMAPVVQSSMTARRIAALGLGAMSALAIGGGIAAAYSAKARYDDAGPHCDATGCDETGQSIQHGAVVQGNIGTALIAFGALCGATGIYLWIIGAPPEKKAAATPSAGFAVTGFPIPGGGNPLGAALRGRF